MRQTDLPLLDLAELDGDAATVESFRERLREATHTVGFFHLRHRIPPEVIEELFDVSRRFFALPAEDKLDIEMTRSPQFRGYTRAGGEYTEGAADWREQIDVAIEREVRPSPERDYQRLEGPNQWPANLPELRPVIEAWIDRLTTIGMRLVQEWAVSLGAPRDHFDTTFDLPSILLKLVRYPGQDEATQGVGAHKDPGILTMLLIEPGKGGLQVESNGEWIDVPPTGDCFVVNIGELMEVATDGYLRATKHRVVSPEPGTERLSIPMFFNPNLDAEIPPIDLPPELAARARGVEQDADNILGTRYGENLLKARLRAHPDVAKLHHPDLIKS